jgi:hypothetical protein
MSSSYSRSTALIIFAVLLFYDATAQQRPADTFVVSTVAQSTEGAFDAAVDSSGNVLYVSNNLHAVFRVLTTASGGSQMLIAGSGSNDDHGSKDGVGTDARFYFPAGITCDANSNVIYLSDTSNHRIRRLNLSANRVTTFAGSAQGYTDAVGTAALFRNPWGIVHHRSGVLYLCGVLRCPCQEDHRCYGQCYHTAATLFCADQFLLPLRDQQRCIPLRFDRIHSGACQHC